MIYYNKAMAIVAQHTNKIKKYRQLIAPLT